MTHPLISRLTDQLGWPLCSTWEELTEFTERPGWQVAFVPGDVARNLETADVAVILPELRMAFQGVFDCAVIDDAIESRLRHETKVLKCPSLIFFYNGEFVAGIPKVRDWDEYMSRITQILVKPSLAAE